MMFVSDLDDTLYSEIDYVRSGCRAVARAVEQQGWMDAPSALALIQGQESVEAGFDALLERINQLAPQAGCTIGWILEVYRTHMPDISLRPGVAETLDRLLEAGIPMAIITDGRSVAQRNKIKALGLDRYVPEGNIIISEEIGNDKNSPLPFATLMERFPAESRFLYIGDNPAKDVHGPNHMGWTTVHLRTDGSNIHPLSPASFPPAYRARHSIATFSELLPLLLHRPHSNH